MHRHPITHHHVCCHNCNLTQLNTGNVQRLCLFSVSARLAPTDVVFRYLLFVQILENELLPSSRVSRSATANPPWLCQGTHQGPGRLCMATAQGCAQQEVATVCLGSHSPGDLLQVYHLVHAPAEIELTLLQREAAEGLMDSRHQELCVIRQQFSLFTACIHLVIYLIIHSFPSILERLLCARHCGKFWG